MKLLVKVIAGSRKEEVVQNENGNLTIYLKKRPYKGEANEELIKVLAKYFKVPKSSVSIKTGQRNKNKIIEII
jgi:uncharacterized protein (TIGR00251 family)